MDTENLSPIGILLLLVLLMMVGAGVGNGLGYLLAQMQGFELVSVLSSFNENSPLKARTLVRLVNL
ncbi:MAG: hypothetical protein KI786_07560, partial [Mameliella sp.]|nr:hypothetical protein [Phaeodactylibacter sp.]